jgi:hypothetical protein
VGIDELGVIKQYVRKFNQFMQTREELRDLPMCESFARLVCALSDAQIHIQSSVETVPESIVIDSNRIIVIPILLCTTLNSNC